MASKNDMDWSQMVPKFMIVSVKIEDRNKVLVFFFIFICAWVLNTNVDIKH